MKTARSHQRIKLPATFTGLCKLHMLRPITDKVSFENAEEVAERWLSWTAARPIRTIILNRSHC